MKKADKVVVIADLEKKLRESTAVLLTEYRGLSVAQLKELRKSLGDSANYAVVKNTLASIAARNSGFDFLVDELSGPTAIAFVTGEAVDAAKALRNFSRENDALVLKGGMMDGSALTAEDVSKLADLESREVLLAKAAGALKAKLHQAAYLFTAPATKAVRTIDALREKQAQEG